MNESTKCRLSSPLHLQISTEPRHRQVMSVREHLLPHANDDPALPLVVLTYHPGYAAGSYENRDYFELLTPLLFDCFQSCFRLRIFTINHPGYDLPRSYKVDRFDVAPYSIRSQPAIIEQVLRWLLLRHFAGERDISLVAYGHSMGGLALAQTDLRKLQSAVTNQGRRLQIQKVLSAPALILHENARKGLAQLKALKALKYTIGRLPLYESVSRTLYRSFVPALYRREAGKKYALNPDCTFLDFKRYNPFILLEQGLELLKLNLARENLATLLDGSQLILSSEDRVVDSPALLQAAHYANDSGAAVQVQTINSSHNAERDDPQLIVDALCPIMQPLRVGSYQPLAVSA